MYVNNTLWFNLLPHTHTHTQDYPEGLSLREGSRSKGFCDSNVSHCVILTDKKKLTNTLHLNTHTHTHTHCQSLISLAEITDTHTHTNTRTHTLSHTHTHTKLKHPFFK